jgi:hypothetical protein
MLGQHIFTQMGNLRMLKKTSNLLKDLLWRSSRNAARPYIPQPPRQGQDSLQGQSGSSYKETNVDIETVGGLAFGSTEELTVDQDGNANRICQKQGHILGSGRLVTSSEPTVKDGTPLPGVGGACYACKLEALDMLQAGVIDIQEAERLSLFDTNSVAQCDACGRRDLCIRHCRPFDKADGTQVSLCPDCIKQAQREKWVANSLNILLSPFIDQKQLPPGRQGENDDG